MEEIPTRCPDPRVSRCATATLTMPAKPRTFTAIVSRSGSHASAAFSQPVPALDDEEFHIMQFFDELSQKWHGQLGLGDIDRLDHAGTRQLRPKLSQQIGAPRNDTDAIAIE